MNTIHKTVRDFAIRHRINLGRYGTGYYFIRCPFTLDEVSISFEPTAKSALAMMRRYLRRIHSAV